MPTRDEDGASESVGLTNYLSPVSRRAFMSATAASAVGYTLAAGPVCAGPITTNTAGLDAGEAMVNVEAGQMPVYFARPVAAANPPIVLVAMEIFGLHEYIRDVTRRIAKLGAMAIAPDYYFKMGDLTSISDMAKLRPLVNAKPDAELLSELDASVAWAITQGGDPTRVGITGFCRGGRTVWIYCANNSAIKAGVAFYGSLVDPPAQKSVWPKSPTELATEMKAPVLGLYGGADQGIPVEQVEAMRSALASAGNKSQIHIYPDAPHAFHADYRPSYRPDIAEDAFGRMATWFKTHGVLE